MARPNKMVDGEIVPLTDAEWAEYQAAQGPKSESVPDSVTMRQARLALSRAGVLKAANDAIEAMEGQPGEEARIEWDYAAELRRDHPLVAGLGQSLGLDDEAIDDLFREAKTL